MFLFCLFCLSVCPFVSFPFFFLKCKKKAENKDSGFAMLNKQY